MNTVLDPLFLRRPKIDYLSPGICEATFSSTGSPVIILPDFHRRRGPTGLFITGSFGHRRLHWDAYPDALCYNVYMADCVEGVDPLTLPYHLIAECVSENFLDLPDEGCYRVSAITLEGESDLSDPICTCEFPPPPPLVAPVLSRNGRVLSWTVTGAQPATAHVQRTLDGTNWSDYGSAAWTGTLHVNSDFDYRVIGFNGATPATLVSNTVNVPLHPTAVTWRETVIAEGGTLNGAASTRAQSDACYDLDEFGITGQLLTLNGFVPDSLIATRTPLIPGGVALWDNFNFVDADLTVNGLKGNGVDKTLNTRQRPAFTSGIQQDSASLFAYVSTTTALLPNRVPIGHGDAGLGMTLIAPDTTNSFQWVCWDNSVSLVQAGNGYLAGFLLGTRVGPNENNLYFANSTHPWSLLGTNPAATIGTPPTGEIYTHSFRFPTGENSFIDQNLSAAGMGLGLTSAQGSHLFDILQALRIALGGGFV